MRKQVAFWSLVLAVAAMMLLVACGPAPTPEVVEKVVEQTVVVEKEKVVEKTEVIDLPIAIEEALRFAVSAGVIVPEHQALPGQLAEMAAQAAEASSTEDRKE